MRISFDPAKRAEALRKRRIDFLDAERVFAGLTYTIPRPAGFPIRKSGSLLSGCCRAAW
jgi:hypothetical protein